MNDLSSSDADIKNATADLALIREMMQEGRNRIAIDGSVLALWGTLVALAFLGNWLRALGFIPLSQNTIWLTFMGSGWALTFIIGHKMDRSIGRGSPLVRGYVAAWTGVGLSMAGALIAAVTGAVNLSGATMGLLSSALIGSAFFLTARLFRLNWLLIPAVGWWAVFIWLSHLDYADESIFLIFAGFSAVLLLGPGIKLMLDARKFRASRD